MPCSIKLNSFPSTINDCENSVSLSMASDLVSSCLSIISPSATTAVLLIIRTSNQKLMAIRLLPTVIGMPIPLQVLEIILACSMGQPSSRKILLLPTPHIFGDSSTARPIPMRVGDTLNNLPSRCIGPDWSLREYLTRFVIKSNLRF